MGRGQRAIAVLDQVQMLDQEVAIARTIAEQRADLSQRRRIDLPPFRVRLRPAPAHLGLTAGTQVPRSLLHDACPPALERSRRPGDRDGHSSASRQQGRQGDNCHCGQGGFLFVSWKGWSSIRGPFRVAGVRPRTPARPIRGPRTDPSHPISHSNPRGKLSCQLDHTRRAGRSNLLSRPEGLTHSQINIGRPRPNRTLPSENSEAE